MHHLQPDLPPTSLTHPLNSRHTPFGSALSFVQLAERPDPEEAEKAARATRQALDRLVDGKISAAQPKTLPQQPGAPQFIKYTPSQQGPQYNSGAAQRIIRMQVRARSGSFLVEEDLGMRVLPRSGMLLALFLSSCLRQCLPRVCWVC